MSKLHCVLVAAAFAGLISSPAFAQGGKITGIVEAKPSKFLNDTIVFIKVVPGTKPTAQTFEIDQKGLKFDPHIVLLAVGDTVKFHNHDKLDHNVTSPDGGYDLGSWSLGQTKEHAFKTEGVFAQVCKLHPEMLAYVFVGQNRFAAIVDGHGAFSIAGVPPGNYELAIWNQKLKAATQKVTVVADKTATASFSLTR